MLEINKIDPSRVHIFVANQSEKAKYKRPIPKKYSQLIKIQIIILNYFLLPQESFLINFQHLKLKKNIILMDTFF